MSDTGPIRFSVTVNLPPEEAFRLFTGGVELWWPLQTHAIDETRATGAVFEPGEGGRIYERYPDGGEAEWGRVITWDPPKRVVYSWNPTLEPRPDTEIEALFTADGDGTRVDVEHRGWERLDPELRESYASDTGWTVVIGRYVAAAG